MTTATPGREPDVELAMSQTSLRSPPPLSCTFLRRWAELPSELLLRILTNLSEHHHVIDQTIYDKVLEQLYLPLLTTPWAGIATEALFANNLFEISIVSKRYPPRDQNTWIRRLQITMADEEVTQGWLFLKKICTGALGFERLSEIDLTIISNRRKGDPQASGLFSIFDLGLSHRSLTPILFNVEKLSITRKIMFTDNVLARIWWGPMPSGFLGRARLWGAIRLEGDYIATFPIPMGFIDVHGKLHSYRQLPFRETNHPNRQLPFRETNEPNIGLTRKKGMLKGFRQTRTLTRKYTS